MKCWLYGDCGLAVVRRNAWNSQSGGVGKGDKVNHVVSIHTQFILNHHQTTKLCNHGNR